MVGKTNPAQSCPRSGPAACLKALKVRRVSDGPLRHLDPKWPIYHPCTANRDARSDFVSLWIIDLRSELPLPGPNLNLRFTAQSGIPRNKGVKGWLALRHSWLPCKSARDNVSNDMAWCSDLQKKRESDLARMGPSPCLEMGFSHLPSPIKRGLWRLARWLPILYSLRTSRPNGTGSLLVFCYLSQIPGGQNSASR